jgi:hypothetical protein
MGQISSKNELQPFGYSKTQKSKILEPVLEEAEKKANQLLRLQLKTDSQVELNIAELGSLLNINACNRGLFRLSPYLGLCEHTTRLLLYD